MIVDIKTALDRYLTHSLTRTLDPGKVSMRVRCMRDDQTERQVQKNATGRARATEKRTAAHNKNLTNPT